MRGDTQTGRVAGALIAAALLVTGCAQDRERAMSAIKVEVVSTEQGHVLMRGGEPHTVKGAGMGTDDIACFAAGGTAHQPLSAGEPATTSLRLLRM